MIERIEFLLALTVALGILFSIGGAFDRLPAYARLLRRRRSARKARNLRRVQHLSDGAITPPWKVADYSAQYASKVAWLGDRYLLANPINRTERQS